MEELVQANVQRFFPGEQVLECHAFRITRNADISIDDDRNSDLLEQMKKIIGARRESDYVRIEISDQASSTLLTFLQELLSVCLEDVYSVPGPLDLTAFRQLTELQGFDHLRYTSWPPQPSVDVDPSKNLFEKIARESILLFHPYESFDPVVRLLEEASDDPDVLAIKQTLYRTSKKSPIIAALKRAAERGKYVTAIVELKARFDEARNIEWAREMEAAGVQVIYGVKGLKTHSKICLIIRRETHGVQRYVHFGTGNYNESTAKIYSDVSYLTCDEELSSDAVSFFNAVTGFSQPQNFRKIEAAPIGLRDKLLTLIASETRRKKQGQDAAIMAKLNSLVDPKLIDAIYEASQAGVKIDLNIRGICCLKPGVAGLSDNIRVISIVDRYLEHARILYFQHGGENLVFISSADWMPRNLDRRVELLVPVEETRHRERLIEILELSFRDTVKCSELQEDGSYKRIRAVGRRKKLRYQEELNQQARAAVKQAEKSKPTVFEPHRAPTNND
jgi:polyphosphate kinase